MHLDANAVLRSWTFLAASGGSYALVATYFQSITCEKLAGDKNANKHGRKEMLWGWYSSPFNEYTTNCT